jgi:hypothetical protein
MKYGDLDKIKVLKTQRESKNDVRKPNSKNVLNVSYRYCTPVRPVCPIPVQVWSLYRICPVLDQKSPVNNMTVGIWALPDKSGPHRTCPGPKPNLLIQRVSIKKCPESVWGHPTSLTGMVDRSALTAPTTSFPDFYKMHSTPSLVGCWFLIICITF